jgi:hypothetical protein
LFFASQQTKLWTVLIIVAIILTFFLLGKYTSILKIGEEDTRYSLALTQMVFWTVLISSGKKLVHTGYVIDGTSVNGNSKWYVNAEGNFFWSGGVR